jgi:hypothetical protein
MARQTEKRRPLGICDLCGDPIPEPYTARGLGRLYCSTECRNAANSRAGSPVRRQKAIARFAQGLQVPPMCLEDPATRGDHARKAARVHGEAMRKQVEAGTWRNPALDPGARDKLSRPRLHGDNPTLHAAIEKRKRGGMASLTPAEHAAYMQHERERVARDPEYLAKRRAQYARRQARKRERGAK